MVVAPKIGGRCERLPRQTGDRRARCALPLYPELKIGPPTLRTYREVKDFQPDIAHFIHPTLVGTGGLIMAKRLNVPTLASFHLDLAGYLTLWATVFWSR